MSGPPRRAARHAIEGMMRKYDDFDYHASGALEGGQPEENGFTHIGFFLAWLIRHSLVDDEFAPSGLAEDLDSGRVLPTELSDMFDGKLVSAMLTDEGDAFADAYYERYLDEYGAEFADLPDYGVPDDPDHEARAAALIDRAYGAWVAEGRPKRRGTPGVVGPRIVDEGMFVGPRPSPEGIMAAIEQLGAAVARRPAVEEVTQAASPLEERLTRAVGARIEWQSSTGANDGSVMGSRRLTALGVRADDVVAVTGMGPTGDPVVQVLEVRGVPAGPLFAEFIRAELGRSIRWREERLDGMPIRIGRMALGRDEPAWETASFAVDGYAVYLTVREGGLDRLNELALSLRAALEVPAG